MSLFRHRFGATLTYSGLWRDACMTRYFTVQRNGVSNCWFLFADSIKESGEFQVGTGVFLPILFVFFGTLEKQSWMAQSTWFIFLISWRTFQRINVVIGGRDSSSLYYYAIYTYNLGTSSVVQTHPSLQPTTSLFIILSHCNLVDLDIPFLFIANGRTRHVVLAKVS